jgi:lipid A 4'-phosphatase
MADSAPERGVVRAWIVGLAALSILAAAVFTLWPQIDLAVAGFFWREGLWIAADSRGVEGFRRIAAIIAFGVPVTAVLLWLLGRLLDRPPGQRVGGRATLVLVLTLALGPGLVVNVGFKDHWGRARPAQITAFGKERAFTPALIPSDQCRRNCSFASGEAATGFGLVVLGLLARRRRILALLPGVALGTSLSVVRMAAGGHFLSDVIFGGLIAAAVAVAVYAVIYRWPRAGWSP